MTEMTREEAEQSVRLIVQKYREIMFVLLEIKERNGHKALGFRSFAEFCEARLKLNRATSTTLVSQAIEIRRLTGKCEPVARTVIEQVRTLPTIENQREVFKRLDIGGVKVTAMAVRKVVQTIHKEIHPQRFEPPYRSCHEVRFLSAERQAGTTDLIISFREPDGLIGYVRLPERYHCVED